MTKGHDQKRDTLPQNQTPNKVFSVLPLESGMFQLQATISIIKFFFGSKCVLYQCMASKLGSGQVWMFVTLQWTQWMS